MRNLTKGLLLMVFVLIPLFSGCQSKQLQEENAALKSQVESLNAEKTTLDSKLKDLTTENSALRSQVEGLTHMRDELSAKLSELAKQLEDSKAPKTKKKKK
ncbi:MAG: hypothetical protein AABZ28_04470 [Nitrospinota bacterium]